MNMNMYKYSMYTYMHACMYIEYAREAWHGLYLLAAAASTFSLRLRLLLER